MDELIKTLLNSGPFGVALAVCLAMGWLYHRSKMGDLDGRLKEHKEDKTQLISLVQSNTETISKNTSAVEHCASAIQQNAQMVQRLLEKTGG